MPPWSVMLFAGDLFGAIPFGVADSTEVRVVEEPLQHFMGEVAFGYGLLISPTCDMYEASYLPEVRRSHPFRVLVPILPLATVIDQTTKVEQSENLIRKRDALQAYMY